MTNAASGRTRALSPVPSRARHVHASTTDGHLLAPKRRKLPRRDTWRAGPVRAQHAVPWHLGAVPRHDHADGACRAKADVLRDVAVGHHAAPRDPVDRVEYALGEHGHLAGHAGRLRP